MPPVATSVARHMSTASSCDAAANPPCCGRRELTQDLLAARGCAVEEEKPSCLQVRELGKPSFSLAGSAHSAAVSPGSSPTAIHARVLLRWTWTKHCWEARKGPFRLGGDIHVIQERLQFHASSRLVTARSRSPARQHVARACAARA